MGQLVLMPQRAAAGRRERRPEASGRRSDPAATARGILLGLAISSLAWMALALIVPWLLCP